MRKIDKTNQNSKLQQMHTYTTLMQKSLISSEKVHLYHSPCSENSKVQEKPSTADAAL